MNMSTSSRARRGLASLLLIGSVLASAALLAAWKTQTESERRAAAADQPEPVEIVKLATAEPREHHEQTTAIGTVLALRSITLRNELPGTVARVSLTPGQVVEAGTVLVALDATVEQAELLALEAQAKLAETTLQRLERLHRSDAVSQEALDQASAQRDIAQAQIARLRALLTKKSIRAPFRARVGLADIHPGQYLDQGTELTTLQGVSDAAHVDFAVTQRVAAGIPVGSELRVSTHDASKHVLAKVVAIDAKIDPTTRNATVRARIASSEAPAPGASVRVHVPIGRANAAVAIPVSALRKGPGGDHVWVVAQDSTGATRAHERAVEGGPVVGDSVIVLGGLQAGEQVAAAGSFKLRDAIKVQAASELAANTHH